MTKLTQWRIMYVVRVKGKTCYILFINIYVMARTETLTIRMSVEEKGLLERWAKEEKLTLGKFVTRKLFLKDKIEETGEIVTRKPVNKQGRSAEEELALNLKIGQEMRDAGLGGTFIPNRIRN